VDVLQEFVDNFTYLAVLAVLLLGSLGVPIPEEMPILAAAVSWRLRRWRSSACGDGGDRSLGRG